MTLPEHHYAFMLFAKTLVVYVNPKEKNTYGKNGVSPLTITATDWNGISTSLPKFTGTLAERVRIGDFKTILVTLS
jgi:hypothetical protein